MWKQIRDDEQYQSRKVIMDNKVSFFLNGYPQNKKIQQLKKKLGQLFHLNSKMIRLFNPQGVQYQEQDVNLLKNKDIVYVSQGQQFDANSCFAQYQFIKKLGQGGYGKVILGRHKQIKKLVAIKIIKICIHSQLERASDVDSVFRQPEILKTLNHPNIVEIYKCYTLKDMKIVVIMEYMQGGTFSLVGQLLKYLQKYGPLNQNNAKIFFRQIVLAIAYCHRNNLVHRDLKLENILLSKPDQKHIKIADFGISGSKSNFKNDADVGTLMYMAPQILNRQEKGYSFAVDIWACGCILFSLIFGQLPFQGINTQHIIKNICNGNYKIPKNTNRNLSMQLIDCLQKQYYIKGMLTVNPKKRIKSQELIEHSWLNKNQFNRFLPVLSQQQKNKQLEKQKTEKIKLPIQGKKQNINYIKKNYRILKMKKNQQRSIKGSAKMYTQMKKQELNKNIYNKNKFMRKKTQLMLQKQLQKIEFKIKKKSIIKKYRINSGIQNLRI